MKKHNAIHCAAIAVTVISFAILVMVSCSSKSVLEEIPDTATISVTASPSSVPTDSTAIIEAKVADGDVGLSNQEVTFSVDPSNAGEFSYTVVTTDTDGYAVTIFTANTIGTAQISAAVSGSSITGSVGITITESQQTGSGNIEITVSPSLLLANGSDTSVVTITVRDDTYQPAPDSTLVKITAGEKFIDIDENGYWSEGIDSLVFDANSNGQWDAVGLIPSTAFTAGGAGQAVVNYIAGSNALTVYIKATVDDNGIQGSADRSIQLSPDASINSIYLASDSINLVVKQTGGIETALLYATGYDINGNAVPEGLTINFIITDGPGGGEHLGTVGYGPYTAVTNSQGIATASIHSGTASGTIRIRAYADTVLSNATQVMVSSGPPAYIVVGSEFCNVDYWDDVGEKVGITAVVSDIYLNPVNDSTVVYFSTDEGTMKSHEERTKDQEGIVTTVWISGNNVDSADGVVAVMAETAGGTVADTSYFFNSHFAAVLGGLTVTYWETSIPADGESYFYAVVNGVDLNGNPVISGTKLEVEARYLNVAGIIFGDGCYSSSAKGKVTSKTLNVDASLTGANDNGVGAIDTVTYSHAAGASVTAVCSLLTVNTYRGNSTINGASSANPGETVYYSVTIKDRFGNPLGDHTLNMIASGGVVSGATQETDGYGEANGFEWTAPATPATYTITVTDADPRGGGITLTKTVTVQE